MAAAGAACGGLSAMRQRNSGAAADKCEADSAVGQQEDERKRKQQSENSLRHYIALIVLGLVTYVSIPPQGDAAEGRLADVRRVWWYGLVTALSTGVGALPFLVARDIPAFWVGVANGESLRSMIPSLC